MLIIPAIDLKNGYCVRLSQGRMDEATIYSDDPVATALRWQADGARRLHIVDLDGALSGMPANAHAVEKICAAVKMEIQIGGGIRSLETIKRYIDLGVSYVILGTAAVINPDFLRAACEAYPGRIIVGIDARDGMVAVRGWTKTTDVSAVEFARCLDSSRIAAIVFTDISRDGMLSGINIQSTAELARAIPIPIIASGGVATIEDVRSLLSIEAGGVIGVIIGRALYTGAIDLKECIALASTSSGNASYAGKTHHPVS